MRKALYILGELEDRDIVWLATIGKRLSLGEGQPVIRAGQAIDTLYLVVDGRLTVTIEGGTSLAELGPGDIVGEMSLIEKRPPSATVTTRSQCLLLSIAHATLREELDRNEGLAARFYRALAIFLSDRLRGTVSRLGYGTTGSGDGPESFADENELDEVVLDRVSLAGDRLRRLIEMVER